MFSHPSSAPDRSTILSPARQDILFFWQRDSVALAPTTPQKSADFRGRHFLAMCRPCRPRLGIGGRPTRVGFRLLFTALSPTCAPVRSGRGPGRERAFKHGRQRRAVPPPSPGFFRPRPAMARKDAREGIRPRGQFGHQDRRIQPPGRKNV